MRGGRRQGGGRQGGRGRDARKEVGRCAVYSAVYRVQCTTCRVRRVLYRADLTYYLAGRGGVGGREGGREVEREGEYTALWWELPGSV